MLQCVLWRRTTFKSCKTSWVSVYLIFLLLLWIRMFFFSLKRRWNLSKIQWISTIIMLFEISLTGYALRIECQEWYFFGNCSDQLFNINSWFNHFWWFWNESDCLSIETIWNNIEITLFYYSDNSTAGHLCPEWLSKLYHSWTIFNKKSIYVPVYISFSPLKH